MAASTRSSVTLLGRIWLSIICARAASNTVILFPVANEQSRYSGGVEPVQSAEHAVSARQPFDRLPVRQAGEKLPRGLHKDRMAPTGCDFGQWLEHEAALMQARMRQDQLLRLDLLPLVIKQIEVDDARRIAHAANPPKSHLDRLHHPQQAGSVELGLHCGDGVDEP